MLLLSLSARSGPSRWIYAGKGSYHFYLLDSKLLKLGNWGSTWASCILRGATSWEPVLVSSKDQCKFPAFKASPQLVDGITSYLGIYPNTSTVDCCQCRQIKASVDGFRPKAVQGFMVLLKASNDGTWWSTNKTWTVRVWKLLVCLYQALHESFMFRVVLYFYNCFSDIQSKRKRCFAPVLVCFSIDSHSVEKVNQLAEQQRRTSHRGGIL